MSIQIQNQWLKELEGKTYSKNIYDQAMKFMREEQNKFYETSGIPVKETALVTAVNDGELKSIGASCPDDLILNQFGQLLAGVMGAPTQSRRNDNIQDTGNTARDIWIVEGNAYYNDTQFGAVGCWLQLGDSATDATRADYNVSSALDTSPESSALVPTVPAYSAGEITFNGSVVTGGAGSVRESCIFYTGLSGAVAIRYSFCLVRDIISPAVSYIASDTLTVNYTVSL